MKNSESSISIETSESDNQEFKRVKLSNKDRQKRHRLKKKKELEISYLKNKRLINCLNSDKEGEKQISIENSKNENLDFFSNKMIKEMNLSSEKSKNL